MVLHKPVILALWEGEAGMPLNSNLAGYTQILLWLLILCVLFAIHVIVQSSESGGGEADISLVFLDF